MSIYFPMFLPFFKHSFYLILFSKKLPAPAKGKQKNRIYKIFKFFKNNKLFFKLKVLQNFRLFINNIKLINFFLRKSISKFRRQSRKEYYKKLNEKGTRTKKRIRPEKDIIKRFSTVKLLKNFWYFEFLKKPKIYLSKYRRIYNNYLCFNSKKFPFSKKSTNSRMGKGKGNIKNWYIQFFSGKTIFYLLRWNSPIALFVLKLVKMYIPGLVIIQVPFIKKLKNYFFSATFLI